MKRPEITGWQITTNENGIEMATLPAEQLRKAVLYMEHAEKRLSIGSVSNRFDEEKFITNCCFSYRHDYGLMLEKQQKKLRFECSEWMRAIKNSEPHF